MNTSSREILNALADCLSESAVRLEPNGEYDRLWLPKPSAADYALYIDTRDGGGGLLIGAQPTGAPAGVFFWHLPLEYPPEDEQKALDAVDVRTYQWLRVGLLPISLECGSSRSSTGPNRTRQQ